MPRAKVNKVAEQLDMLKALDEPSKDKERFITTCLDIVRNNQYLHIQFIISDLTEVQKKYMSAKMAESNLTLCQLCYYIGLETSKYRKWSAKQYDKLAEIPDNLSYTQPWNMTELHESMTKTVGKITGLFIANKEIVDPWKIEANRIIKGLVAVRDYAREQLYNG